MTMKKRLLTILLALALVDDSNLLRVLHCI